MQIAINRSINKETKFYGLKLLGLIIAGVLMIFIWIKFNTTAAILSASAGYGIGATISAYWHNGSLQKWCYWHLPIYLVLRSKYMPSSHLRLFL